MATGGWRILALLGAAGSGCGGAAATGGAGTGPAATTAGGTVVVAAPIIPRATFDVAPGELADADVYSRLRHRVRLAREGVARLQLDGPRVDDTGHANTLDTRPTYPVIAETPERVRIVIEEDQARIALWVERADTAETVLAAVQVADATGHAPATSGLWLGAGASLDAGERGGADGYRQVTLRSQWLRATGFVPAAAIGNVWIAGEREGYEPSTAEDDSKPPVATGKTVAVSTLRAAPDDGSALVAEIAKAAPVRVVHETAGWAEIEIHVPRVRVRGFVPATAVTAGDHAEYGRFGHGHGFGMSDAARVTVPAGACLYDAAGGEVAGVQVGETERFVHGGARTPGWWPVAVPTTWGLVIAFVHDTAQTADPKAVVLESCRAKH